MISHRRGVCHEVRTVALYRTLSGTGIECLPDELIREIARTAAHRNDDDGGHRLLRIHNMCYIFRNPIIRVFQEMDRW